MGDRGNIYVHEGTVPGVYLYTHWDGSDLDQIVKLGLTYGWDRRGDAQYLARILFDQLTGKQRGTTGYGISAVLEDGGDQMVDVDTTTQTVKNLRGRVFSFGDFADASPTGEDELTPQ